MSQVTGRPVKALVVEDISKRFGGIHALEAVSFTVEEREKIAIIGPNGAGKTTLFNSISGELKLTGGKVYLFGEDVTNMPSNLRAHRGVARTFQITNLFLSLTLRENLLLAVLGTSPWRLCIHRSVDSFHQVTDRTSELIRSQGLEEFENSPIEKLSYGVQRQVEVVMALASDAKILLLDEPTAGLSAAETSVLSSMLSNLDQSITLLIIEHDIDVAFKLANHIVVLNHGRVLADGPPSAVAKDPKVRSIYLGDL